AGSGRLEVHQFTRQPGNNRIDAELVGARMKAELVGTEGRGDSQMTGERLFKIGQAADVIDSLLETSHVSGGQADPAYSQAFEFLGNENVFGQAGDGLGLIHTHLQLERPGVHYIDQM